MRKRLAGAASAAAILIVMTAPAHAHVEVSTEEAPAGGEVAFDFLVGHGCDESGTTSLSVQMPEGVAEVAPEDEPGWSLTTKESGENVTEVTWTARGKPLDPHHLGRFGISLALPDGQPGDAVYFPTIQRCEQGVTRWIQIPSEGQTEDDLENPAPAITLTAGDEGAHAASDDESATAENLDAQPAAAAEEDGSDAIAWVALAVGAAGLIVGGAAFARSRG